MPMESDRLEQLGVRLGTALKSSQVAAAQRQMRDRELEGRQKVWQWLIATADPAGGRGLVGRSARTAAEALT